MLRLILSLATLLLLSGVALACGGEAQTAPALTVTTVPWSEEEARYTLQDTSGNTVATAVLSIQQDGDAYLLTQYFETATTKDRLETRVRASDLKPIASERQVTGDQGDLRIEAQYREGILAINWSTDEDMRSRQVNISPDVYDNGASLFLWRALPFAEGYRAVYQSLNTSQVRVPQKIEVTLDVVGQEIVEVPAGTFTAWRVQITASGERHTAWYAVDGTQPLVKYDNGDQVFLLESYSPNVSRQP